MEEMEFDAPKESASLLSAIFLIAGVLVAPPLAWLSLGSDQAIIRGIGLLLVPAFLVAWLYYGIHALHLRGLGLFSLRTTYVNFICYLSAAVLAYLGVVTSGRPPQPEINVLNSTLFAAAAIVSCCCVAWTFWYNYRSTGSLLLTLSISVLQTLLGFAFPLVITLCFITRGQKNR